MARNCDDNNVSKTKKATVFRDSRKRVMDFVLMELTALETFKKTRMRSRVAKF